MLLIGLVIHDGTEFLVCHDEESVCLPIMEHEEDQPFVMTAIRLAKEAFSLDLCPLNLNRVRDIGEYQFPSGQIRLFSLFWSPLPDFRRIEFCDATKILENPMGEIVRGARCKMSAY